jgi:RND family efflux transporter MFP subunit
MTRFLPAVFAFATIELGIACWQFFPGLAARVNTWLPADPRVTDARAELKAISPEDAVPVAVIRTSGELKSAEEAALTAPVAGILENLRYQIGEPVTAGSVIASIRPVELIEKLKESEAELNAAEADAEAKEHRLKESETVLARTRDLWNRDLIPRQDTTRAEAALAGARADTELARAVVAEQKAKLEQLRYQLRFTKIVAPFDGVITQRFSRADSRIRQGQAIVAYGSLDLLRIRIAVPPADADAVQIGAPAEVRVERFPDRVFTGAVRDLWAPSYGAIDIEAEVEIANEGRILKPGMRASVVLTGKAKLTSYSSDTTARSYQN